MALKDVREDEKTVINGYLNALETMCERRPDAVVILSDEEGLVHKGVFDRKVLEDYFGEVDLLYITVDLGDRERHRTMFIHGNGEDVISDSAFNKESEWMDLALCGWSS